MRSVSQSIHGSSAHTEVSANGSHTTNTRPKAKTSPARNAPAKRAHSARASTNVPSAATNSFSAPIRLRDHQKGRTYVGSVKGAKTADCSLATNGRPPITYGFQSGTSGRRSREYWKNGWKTVTGSTSSLLAPSGRTSGGRNVVHGATDHR